MGRKDPSGKFQPQGLLACALDLCPGVFYSPGATDETQAGAACGNWTNLTGPKGGGAAFITQDGQDHVAQDDPDYIAGSVVVTATGGSYPPERSELIGH